MEITVNINQHNWQLLSEICKALKLRRDAYLSECLPAEIAEIESLPVSDPAGAKHQRLLSRLEQQGGKRVTISLDDLIAERLTKVCVDKNIPRNAFFDSFVWFLCVRLARPALVVSQPRRTLEWSRQQFDEQIKLLLIADQFEIDLALEPNYYAMTLVWTSERLEQQQMQLKNLALPLSHKAAPSSRHDRTKSLVR